MATKLNNEKLATSPITADRVLVKSLSLPFHINHQPFPARHGIEFRVEDLLNTQVSQVVVIENLAVFLALHDYPICLTDLSHDALAIYRGGQGLFSAQGSQAFLARYQGQKIGFFDFDPAGLCQLGMKHLSALLLPALADDAQCVQRLIDANKPNVYADQQTQYQACLQKHIQQESILAPWCNMMQKHHLSVMQEIMISRHFPLVIQPLNDY